MLGEKWIEQVFHITNQERFAALKASAELVRGLELMEEGLEA